MLYEGSEDAGEIVKKFRWSTEDSLSKFTKFYRNFENFRPNFMQIYEKNVKNYVRGKMKI